MNRQVFEHCSWTNLGLNDLLSRELSIVIPTYCRPVKLNNLLSSIAKSPPKSDYELVVVDDSEKVSSISDQMRLTFGDRLKVIYNSPRGFISRAKNVGWKKSSGAFIFFVDDDNILPDGTADSLLKRLKADSRIGALMPMTYYAQKKDLVWVYSTPFSKGRWSFELVGRNSIEVKKPSEQLMSTDALPNASMIRRNVLELVGGFDEGLPVNSSCDLCQRIKKAGFNTYSFTEAAIYHDVSLPGIPGYWAEHAAEDVQRRYYEVRDWFDLMSRLHRGEDLLIFKELLRSMKFIAPVGAGVLMHPSRRKQRISSLYLSMIRGIKDGIQIAARAG